MQVEYDEGALSTRDIITCVEKAGYGASLAEAAAAPGTKAAPAKPKENVADQRAARKQKRSLNYRLKLSARLNILC